jgi:hypothetical protein
MLFQNTISYLPFKQWLLQDKENKQLFWLSLVVMVVSFTWLKIAYPYPNFMPPDSYNYLEAAYRNDFINIWPIGYSRFLRLVSSFSNSHMVLVVLQYLLLMASVLYFYFSLRYLLSPGKWLFRIMLTVGIVNPLLPHIANFVSSDCLFTTLSLVWFTQLLRILYQPTLRLLLVHAIILLLAFMFRFTAIWYPFMSIAIIALGPMPRNTKLLGISSIAFLLLLFIGSSKYEYQVKTGTTQYAAFGGWQMAANALYGYAYATPADPATVPNKFRELHTLVNHHMDSIRRLARRPDQEIGVYYFWDFKSPLIIYMNKQWQKTPNRPYFKKWASMAPLYADYGRYLVARHPGPFIQHYVWPNLVRYYMPPAYFMEYYNMLNTTADPIASTWFDWTNNQLPVRTKDRQIHIIGIFPSLLAVLNPLFLLSSLVFIFSTSFGNCSLFCKRIIAFMFTIWIFNASFSVLSAPIELRYQLFPVVITLSFSMFLIVGIIKSMQSIKANEQQPTIPLPG